MIKYLKVKIAFAMVAILLMSILGFYTFFKDGSTFLLKLSVSSFVIHLLLYYFFIKKPEHKSLPKAK